MLHPHSSLRAGSRVIWQMLNGMREQLDAETLSSLEGYLQHIDLGNQGDVLDTGVRVYSTRSPQGDRLKIYLFTPEHMGEVDHVEHEGHSRELYAESEGAGAILVLRAVDDLLDSEDSSHAEEGGDSVSASASAWGSSVGGDMEDGSDGWTGSKRSREDEEDDDGDDDGDYDDYDEEESFKRMRLAGGDFTAVHLAKQRILDVERATGVRDVEARRRFNAQLRLHGGELVSASSPCGRGCEEVGNARGSSLIVATP